MSHAIDTLFPAHVVSIELSDPAHAEPLFPEEEAGILKAVEKRKLEFTLGRTAARHALARLGIERVPLTQNSDRSVAWPEQAWGSITHTEGLCAAAVARRDVIAGIGIDAEVNTRVHERLWRTIASEQEIAWFRAAGDEAASRLRAALLFSAKEAFYKAQFCVSRAWVGFHDAELLFDERGSFEVTLLIDVAECFAKGTRFEGRYLVRDEHVVTGLVIAPR